MQKVMVQIDWYTKIILTLIVVLLAGLLARPYIASGPAKGGPGDQAVYITNDFPIRVSLEGNNGVYVENWPNTMQVKLKNNNVSAYITGSKGPLFVVDWKEQEDYLEYLEERY